MHLKFEVTLDDLIEYSYYTNWARPGKRWKRIVYTWGFGILLIEFLVLRYFLHDENIFIQGLIAGLLLLILVLRLCFTRWGIRKFYLGALKRDPKRYLMGDRVLDINDTEVVLSMQGVSSSLNWSLLSGLRETDRYLYLQLNKTQAIIIPKRIFLLEQELYEVKSFIESKIRTAS